MVGAWLMFQVLISGYLLNYYLSFRLMDLCVEELTHKVVWT